MEDIFKKREVGYIKLYRAILDSWIAPQKRPYTYMEAWIYILLRANFTPGKELINGELFEIKRGQLFTSQLKISTVFKWSRNKVKRFLDLLEKDRMIVCKTNRYATTITICKYATYQDASGVREAPDEAPDDTSGETTGETSDGALYKNIRSKEGKEGREAQIKFLVSEQILSEIHLEDGARLNNTTVETFKKYAESKLDRIFVSRLHEKYTVHTISKIIIEDFQKEKANFLFKPVKPKTEADEW